MLPLGRSRMWKKFAFCVHTTHTVFDLNSSTKREKNSMHRRANICGRVWVKPQQRYFFSWCFHYLSWPTYPEQERRAVREQHDDRLGCWWNEKLTWNSTDFFSEVIILKYTPTKKNSNIKISLANKPESQRSKKKTVWVRESRECWAAAAEKEKKRAAENFHRPNQQKTKET